MNVAARLLVLLAAFLHAAWNAIVKRSTDQWLSTVLVATSAALAAAVLLPLPARASWMFIAVSVSLQVAYYFLVAHAYHAADMSQTYPLMRGTVPILVALVAVFGFGEMLFLPAWFGIGAICAGVLIAWLMLGERLARRRMLAVGMIALGLRCCV